MTPIDTFINRFQLTLPNDRVNQPLHAQNGSCIAADYQ